VITWGWRQAKPWRDQGHDVLVLERAYVGDRRAMCAAGWNGLNGRAAFPAFDDAGSRWGEHFAHLMRPWRAGGEYVLLIGQVIGDAATAGMDLCRWYLQMAKFLREHYDIPVLFRPHPVEVQRGTATVVPGVPALHGSLAEAIDQAALVVTFNSNVGTEAVLAGVPTLASDAGSMVYQLLKQEAPDRGAWASRMAWCQWLPEDFTSGRAWAHLRNVAACKPL
jgi:hypothetical protein